MIHQYLNRQTRLTFRALFSTAIGIFATWKWLTISVGIVGLIEGIIMHKALTMITRGTSQLKLSSRERGRIMGITTVSAISAAFSMFTIAAIVKFLRNLAISFL